MRFFVFLVFLLSLPVPSPARCETGPAEELARIEKELAEQKAEAATLEEKAQTTQQEIGQLQQRLIDATAALQKKQEDQGRLEDRLQKLEKETEGRAKALSNARQRLADFTSALLRLGREPPETFLLQSSLTSDHIHRVVLLRSLVPHLRAETLRIAAELNNLETLREVAAGQKKLVAAAGKNLEERQRNLDRLIQTRHDMLQQTAAEKEAVAEQMAALSAEARDLRQLIEKVSHRESLPKSAPKAPRKLTLKLPVAGRILRNFGSKDSYGVASHGLTLSAAPGSPVMAPLKGRVVFTGPFKGYGQIVIVQHGEGAHSLLGGFGRIDVSRGQKVETGEPLGVLPGKGKERPEIYFEWRQNGEPADPMAKTVSQDSLRR